MYNTSMRIRQYQAVDLESLIEVWERASEIGHPFLSEEFIESERKNIPLVYLPNGDTWVASVHNNVVGFMILHGSEIGALFVAPDYHGLGVGYGLMTRASQIHDQLKLEVFKENTIGNAFYSRFGFELEREYLHKESGMMMSCLKYRNDS